MQSCSRNSFQSIKLSPSKDESLLPLKYPASRSIFNCSVDSQLNSAPIVFFPACPQDHQSAQEFLPSVPLCENGAKTDVTTNETKNNNNNNNNNSSSSSDGKCNNGSLQDVTSVATINGVGGKIFCCDSAEYNSDVSDHNNTTTTTTTTNTTTNSNKSFSVVNTRRFMNPAFSFSPGVVSGGEKMSMSSSTQWVEIHTDRKSPPDKYIYVLGTMEGRRNFFADCHYLAKHMSVSMIINELIAAMLIASNYNDSLLSLASALPKVIGCIQDLNEDVFVYFMGIIMNLCCSVDHAVLRKIASSLAELFSRVTNEIAEDLLLPFLMSMQVSFWSSPRAVAAALLGVFATRENIVKKSGMTVKQWFDCFTALAKDKSDFVREIALSSLHQWVLVAKKYKVDFAVMPLRLFYELLEGTENNTLRHLCVTEFISLAEHMGKEMTTKYLKLPFITLCSDSVWRVRYIVAKHFGKFVTLCICADGFLDVFMALCSDENKEIRAAAIEQLAVFISNVNSEEALCKICIVATSLAKDKEPVVRMAVANLIYLFFSPNVFEVCTVEQLKIVFGLLTDEDHVVGQHATRNLEKVALNLTKYKRYLTGSDFNTNTNIISNTSVFLQKFGKRRSINNTFFTNVNNNDDRQNRGRNVSFCAISVMENTEISLLSSQEEECEQLQRSLCEGRREERKKGKGRQKKQQQQQQQMLKWRGSEKQRELFISVLDCIIDHLRTVCQSRNWRIRERAVVVIRYFSVVVSEERFLPFTRIVRSLLRDNVSAVRKGAVETLCAVASAYGPEWAALVAFDLLQNEFAAIAEQCYLWRAVAIKCLSATLCVVCRLSPMDLRRQELLQQWVRLVENFSKDAVSNVRLALAKSMVEWWGLYVECGVHHGVVIRMCLERLQHDDDVDVSRLAAGLILPCRSADG